MDQRNLFRNIELQRWCDAMNYGGRQGLQWPRRWFVIILVMLLGVVATPSSASAQEIYVGETSGRVFSLPRFSYIIAHAFSVEVEHKGLNITWEHWVDPKSGGYFEQDLWLTGSHMVGKKVELAVRGSHFNYIGKDAPHSDYSLTGSVRWRLR